MRVSFATRIFRVSTVETTCSRFSMSFIHGYRAKTWFYFAAAILDQRFSTVGYNLPARRRRIQHNICQGIRPGILQRLNQEKSVRRRQDSNTGAPVVPAVEHLMGNSTLCEEGSSYRKDDE